MAESLHHALLCTEEPTELDRQLRELGLGVRPQVVKSLYEGATALAERRFDSLWFPAHDRAEELGALRTIRAIAPQLHFVALLPPGAVELGVALRRLGAIALPWPCGPEALRAALLGSSPQVSPHGWLAGLADLLSNPLAALSGRVQLLRVLQGADNPHEAQLDAALASVQRLEASIQILRRIGAPPAARLHPVDAFAVVGRRLLELQPARVRLDESGEVRLASSDEELLEECCLALGHTLLELAPASDPVTLRREGAGLAIAMEGQGVPMPVEPERFFAPFALQDALRDPASGLEATLAWTLAGQLGAELRIREEKGMLTGFDLGLPAWGQG